MITTEIQNQLYRLILHSEAQKYTIAKLEGKEVKYPHQKNYLTEAELEQSIKGLRSLGIMLIQDKTSLVKAGCLDIDCPRDGEDLTQGLALAKRLQKIALKSNLRAYIEYSGNRGYHFWIFAEKAITASLMQSVLKTIANQANFDCKEYFPNRVPTESKCIKLPTTTHLKSGNRCGFIDEDFDPTNPQINLENQASLMADLIQNSIENLTAVANASTEKLITDDNNFSQNCSTNFNQSNQEKINQKLNSFGNNHPSCINHLLNNGSPLEIDYNHTNLTLARYCISRDYNQEKAIALAELMAKNTSDSHPTSKDYHGKVNNFNSVFNSASRNRDDYQFNCSYILANNKGKLKERGCIGSQCSLFIPKSDNGLNGFHHNSNNFNSPHSSTSANLNNSSSPQYLPLNRFIFEAMINLNNEGKECCKSLILREVEKLIKDTEPQAQPDNISDSIRLIENELLAYLIKDPDVISDCLEMFSKGFTALTNQPLLEYFDYLLNLNLPSNDTLESHLDFIREKGIKAVATSRFSQYQQEIKEAESVEVLNKSIDETERLLKRSLNDKQIQLVEYHLPSLVESLLSEERGSIATPSPHLNNVLNGGFMAGKLYVLGSPPANGKSTICSWCGDYASLNGFRVVYTSYEMSREQLFIASLSRLSGLNSALIERKVFLDPDYHALDTFKSRLFEAVKTYEEKIAPNQVIIEADESYTPNRLKSICKKVEADLLVVDYLQLMSSGDQKLDNSYQETLRVSKIATELKRVARAVNIPVMAISDINKDSYLKAQSGFDLDMGALRDSFKIAHSADVILLLQSGLITTGKGNEKKTVDQLDLLALKYPDKAHTINNFKIEYPLKKSTADTYSRISIVKNRGGKLGEPCFLYSRALHRFEPIDFSLNLNQYET